MRRFGVDPGPTPHDERNAHMPTMLGIGSRAVKLLPTLTIDQWRRRAAELFGDDPFDWRFRCPVCGHVAAGRDWQRVGANQGEVAFSCVGRHIAGSRRAIGGIGPGPCDYAGGGLFALNPQPITMPGGQTMMAFEFAP